jgi:hypothetical protein
MYHMTLFVCVPYVLPPLGPAPCVQSVGPRPLCGPPSPAFLPPPHMYIVLVRFLHYCSPQQVAKIFIVYPASGLT